MPTSGTLPEGQVDSLLSIISSQRERFRTRNQELEAVSPTLLPVPSEAANLHAQMWEGTGLGKTTYVSTTWITCVLCH